MKILRIKLFAQQNSVMYVVEQEIEDGVFQLKEVNRHPWVVAGGKGEMELEDPMMEVVQTHIIPGNDTIDEDVFLVSSIVLSIISANFKLENSCDVKHVKSFPVISIRYKFCISN